MSATTESSPDEFEAALAALDGAIPGAAEYKRLTTLTLHDPAAEALAEMDPFSPEYRGAVLALYARLRGRDTADYLPERDEAPSMPVPADIWRYLSPWGFHDAGLAGEHLEAWAAILRHLGLPPAPGAAASVLEYGPGSGQLLLMLARMGYRACGVDVDPTALEGIRLQADAMRLTVPTERALFGEGFGTERFDAIVFYEAFHHALDFMPLLHRLHQRLKPGGRLILCGEPVVPMPVRDIPYPWGPRLDALSVLCMRRFGWMELGFTHDFLVQAAGRAGWHAAFHPSTICGRAHLYVLRPHSDIADPEPAPPEPPPVEPPPPEPPAEDERLTILQAQIDVLRAELAAVYASRSWKATHAIRAVSRRLKRKRSAQPSVP